MYEPQHETGGATNRALRPSAGDALARMPEKLNLGPGGAKPPLVWGLCRSSFRSSQHCMSRYYRVWCYCSLAWVRGVRCCNAVSVLPRLSQTAHSSGLLCCTCSCDVRDCRGVGTGEKRGFREARAPLNVLLPCPGIAGGRSSRGGVSIVCPF